MTEIPEHLLKRTAARRARLAEQEQADQVSAFDVLNGVGAQSPTSVNHRRIYAVNGSDVGKVKRGKSIDLDRRARRLDQQRQRRQRQMSGSFNISQESQTEQQGVPPTKNVQISGLDEPLRQFLAEQSNGGICSLKVNNLVVSLRNQQREKHRVVQYFSTLCGSVENPVANIPKGVFKKLKASISGHPGQEARTLFTIGDPLLIENLGVRVSYGASGDNVGFVFNGVFAPVARIVDMRSKKDGTCSYAVISNWLFPQAVDEIVAVRSDESNLVLAKRDETRGTDFYAAAEVLDKFLAPYVAENDAKRNEAVLEIFTLFNIEELVYQNLALSMETNYGAERNLRERVALILQMDTQPNDSRKFLSKSRIYPYEPGPADDVQQDVIIIPGKDGSFEIKKQILFPDANEDMVTEMYHARFGSQLGDVTESVFNGKEMVTVENPGTYSFLGEPDVTSYVNEWVRDLHIALRRTPTGPLIGG